MDRTLSPLDRVVRTLTDVVAGIAAFGILVVVLLQVASRLLGAPIPWTEEATRYLFVWMVFLGLAAGFRTVETARVTVFIALVPRLFGRLAVPIYVGSSVLFFVLMALDRIRPGPPAAHDERDRRHPRHSDVDDRHGHADFRGPRHPRHRRIPADATRPHRPSRGQPDPRRDPRSGCQRPPQREDELMSIALLVIFLLPERARRSARRRARPRQRRRAGRVHLDADRPAVAEHVLGDELVPAGRGAAVHPGRRR